MKSFVTFFLILFSLSSCTHLKTEEVSLVSPDLLLRTQVIMGTYVSLRLPEENKSQFAPSFQILSQIDRSLSTYIDSSEVSELNKTGVLQNPSSILNEILTLSKTVTRETDGYFDVSVGSLTEGAYDLKRLQNQSSTSLSPPNSGKIKRDLKLVNSDWIEHDKYHIRFKRKGMHIEFGGIGKGFAVDKVVTHLKANGITHGVVAASGDIGCIGFCRFEVADPDHPAGTIGSFSTLKPYTSISTSGNYERFLGSTAQSHLINSKTGRSENEFKSITLISDGQNGRLDAFATAVAVMPLTQALAFLKRHDEIAYILIRTNDQKILSNNLSIYVDGSTEFLK